MQDMQIGRWNGIDIQSQKAYSISPYTYNFNNPVRFYDPNGQFPMTIYVRSFAPFETFAASNWLGDNRGFTTSTDRSITSRLTQVTYYETTTQEHYSEAIGSISIGLYGGKPLVAQSDAKCDCPSGISSSIRNHLSGNDDAVVPAADGTVFEDYQSPDIDVYSNFTIQTKQMESGFEMLTITGSLIGDAFPAAETFVDIGGTKIFLSVAPPKYGPNTGPFIGLWGDNRRDMTAFQADIIVDPQGKALGVQMGNQVYSPEAWNKAFSNTDATGNK